MDKVLVGMSGGVDSSVAAFLLKENYEVVGCTMKLFNSDDTSIINAKEVCNKLHIEHNIVDFSQYFKENIINYFIDEYNNCRTPNPCVMCNKKIKFGKMYDYCKSIGIKYLATGHYAKVEYSDKYKRYVLKKASNLAKDQSYFLYNIDKEILKYIIFPLSDFNSKDEIRKIAIENNLPSASNSDSQDICFIENDYKEFLNNNGVKDSKGSIILNNKIIGIHNGLYKYTIGQRKGLGVSYSEPLYVINFNKKNNELIVGCKNDLYVKSFFVKDYNLLLIDDLDKNIEVNVKTRYRGISNKALISKVDDLIKVEFLNPQTGVTKGQSAVFYVDDIVLGGGVII